MKSRLLAFLFLAAGATGCVDDRTYLQIFAVCAMEDNCAFDATCGANHLGPVEYNKGDFLMLPLELHNQLADNSDPSTGRTNTNDAHVTVSFIEYEAGGVVIGEESFGAGNQVIPANGTAVVYVYVAGGAAPEGLYTANIYLSGYFDNGNDFEVGPFPIGLIVDSALTFDCATGTDTCPGTNSQSNMFCSGT